MVECGSLERFRRHKKPEKSSVGKKRVSSGFGWTSGVEREGVVEKRGPSMEERRKSWEKKRRSGNGRNQGDRVSLINRSTRIAGKVCWVNRGSQLRKKSIECPKYMSS